MIIYYSADTGETLLELSNRRAKRRYTMILPTHSSHRNVTLTSLSPMTIHSMSTAASKILRTANAPTTAPDEIELTVAQALLDLENNVADLKAELRPLQISAAREVDVKGGKKAIVVFVPVPQLKAFHKIQGR